MPGAPAHHCRRICPSSATRSSPASIGQFARPSSTTASRASNAAVSCSRRARRSSSSMSRRARTLPTTPCAGPRPRYATPYRRCSQYPSESRRRQRASALSLHASRQLSSPVHSCIARAARSVPGVPHMTSSASLSRFCRTCVSRSRPRSVERRRRHATRRIPVSPVSSPASGGEGSSIPAMKSGASRNAASVRVAAAPRSIFESAWPRLPSASRAQMTPAAPT